MREFFVSALPWLCVSGMVCAALLVAQYVQDRVARRKVRGYIARLEALEVAAEKKHVVPRGVLVPVELSGGPCDGFTTVVLAATESFMAAGAGGAGRYVFSSRSLNGRWVFSYDKDFVPVPEVGAGAGDNEVNNTNNTNKKNEL